jgi:hypothetical protein
MGKSVSDGGSGDVSNTYLLQRTKTDPYLNLEAKENNRGCPHYSYDALYEAANPIGTLPPTTYVKLTSPFPFSSRLSSTPQIGQGLG